MLVRVAYLTVSHAFAALRLLPMTDHEEDTGILALRHFLAALLSTLPRATLRRLQLLVTPDTVLHWHRDLVKHRHARVSVNRRPGRPRTLASILWGS